MRKNGMGAVIGRPDELSAVFHNPAGLALLPGTRFFVGVGISFVNTEFRLRPWENSDRYINAPIDADGYYPETQPTRAFGVLPMLVFSTDLWTEKLVAALSVYVPNAIGAAFAENSVARYHLVDSFMIAGYSSLSLAYRLSPVLSVGATFSLLYVRVFGWRKFFPHVEGIDISGLIGSEADLKLTGEAFGFGWTAGFLFQPHSSLSIGVVATGRSDVTLEGPVELIPSADALATESALGSQKTELVIPSSLNIGLNWDILPWLEFGAEFRYYFYSAWKEQLSLLQDLPLVTELRSPKDFHDSWQISGGFRLEVPKVPELEVMVGYHYDRNPAPDTTVSLEQPMFDNTGAHLGVRYTFKGRYRFGATYVHYWYLQRDVTTSTTLPPSNFQGSGRNHMVNLIFEWLIGRGITSNRP